MKVSRNKIILFLAANLGAYGIAAGVNRWLATVMTNQTDIVGFPLFHRFNINKYFRTYYVAAFLFPVAAVAIYHWLGRFFLKGDDKESKNPHPKTIPRKESAIEYAIFSWVRTLLVGFLLTLPLEWSPLPLTFLERGLLFALTYSIFIRLIIYFFDKQKFHQRLSQINALLTSLTVFCLYFTSQQTRVVTTDGQVIDYPWFPLWLAFLLSGIVAAWIVRSLRKIDRSNLGEWVEIEKTAGYFIAVPLLLFYKISILPATVGMMDYFHDGETVASAWLLFKNFFPWRDLLFIHGLLEDPLHSSLGFLVFQKSLWGGAAGQCILFNPISWILLYYLYLWVFRKNRILVFIPTFLLPDLYSPLFGHMHFRFLFIPLIIISYWRLLTKNSWGNAAVFTGLSFVQILITPESSYLAIAGGWGS